MAYDRLMGANITRAGLDGGIIIMPVDIYELFNNTPTLFVRPGDESFLYMKVLAGSFRVKSGDWTPNVVAAVSTVNDTLTLTTLPIKLRTGDKTRIANSGGGLPAPLAANTDYFVYVQDAALGIIKLATSWANLNNGVFIDLTTAGTGTQTIGGLGAIGVSHLDGSGAMNLVPTDNIVAIFAPWAVTIQGAGATDDMQLWWG